MSPTNKGTSFHSDSQLNMNLPCTPCVECLMIVPAVQCEAVQSRWRQPERANIKETKKCFIREIGGSQLSLETFVSVCVTRANCLHSTWDQQTYRRCHPFVAKWVQRKSLPCVSTVTPMCRVVTTSLLVYSANTGGLTPLLYLPVNSTDITGKRRTGQRGPAAWFSRRGRFLILNIAVVQIKAVAVFFFEGKGVKSRVYQCEMILMRRW